MHTPAKPRPAAQRRTRWVYHFALFAAALLSLSGTSGQSLWTGGSLKQGTEVTTATNWPPGLPSPTGGAGQLDGTAAGNLATEHKGGVIRSGVAWYDQNGKVVSAHGAGVIKEGDRYYLFGEFKRDGSNEFAGFSCYSSEDLSNWKFESMAFPAQFSGPLGPGRVGERPKVLKCPKTGEFVMLMHTDDARYKDQAVGYATAPAVAGPYIFRGPLLFAGKPIRKWDIGAFQDDDGSGYLITHSGYLYRLAEDYKSVEAQVVSGMTKDCEAPAIFKRDGMYYWLGSGLTAWERNDNYYFTARSLAGPWDRQGGFAPKSSLTWNSQTTFVLPIVGSKATTYMFMGDRWAHPYQNSAATYVWQPLEFDVSGRISPRGFLSAWEVDPRTGVWRTATPDGRITPIRECGGAKFSGSWRTDTDEGGFADVRSDEKGASLTLPFSGTRIGLHSVARSDGGFGRVEIRDAKGDVVLRTVIETYCLYNESSLKFLSPRLPRGAYVFTLTVLGEHFFWQAKKGKFGSKGDHVSVQKVLIID